MQAMAPAPGRSGDAPPWRARCDAGHERGGAGTRAAGAVGAPTLPVRPPARPDRRLPRLASAPRARLPSGRRGRGRPVRRPPRRAVLRRPPRAGGRKRPRRTRVPIDAAGGLPRGRCGLGRRPSAVAGAAGRRPRAPAAQPAPGPGRAGRDAARVHRRHRERQDDPRRRPHGRYPIGWYPERDATRTRKRRWPLDADSPRRRSGC
jgi:hypothetical protein